MTHAVELSIVDGHYHLMAGFKGAGLNSTHDRDAPGHTICRSARAVLSYEESESLRWRLQVASVGLAKAGDIYGTIVLACGVELCGVESNGE